MIRFFGGEVKLKFPGESKEWDDYVEIVEDAEVEDSLG